MNAKTKTGLEILEAALLLGLLGDALLRATPWGLNVLLWIAALVAAMILLVWRRKRELWTTEKIALYGALIVFAGFVAWRDSLMLQTLDVLVILVILSILSLPALNIKAHLASFSHYALGALNAGFNAAIAPFLLIFDDIEWKTIPRNGWTKHALAIFRGLAIAAPILLVFGALFMAADAVFEGIVKNTLNIKPDVLFSHVLLFSFLAWICAGYLRGVLFGSLIENSFFSSGKHSETSLNLNQPTASVVDNSQATSEKTEKETAPEKREFASYLPEFLRLGAIETGIVLGLINLLFLSFVIVQLRYFFGGMDLVQSTENLKLAEYARRGFFELCWVAALVLPILLTTHFLLRKENPATVKLFRVLALIQIGLLFIIMYSAVQRMLLYTGNLGYGLTEMRLYPTAFMLWLALVFVWFALTVLRGQPQLFAWGALWTALFVVASLHVLNPDNFIVRHNVNLMQQGRQFDAYYMKNLSDDAIPALNESLAAMSFEHQCSVKLEFIHRLRKNKTNDFRTWNFSRWQARRVLLQNEGNFGVVGCRKVNWRQGEPQYYQEGETPRFWDDEINR